MSSIKKECFHGDLSDTATTSEANSWTPHGLSFACKNISVPIGNQVTIIFKSLTMSATLMTWIVCIQYIPRKWNIFSVFNFCHFMWFILVKLYFNWMQFLLSMTQNMSLCFQILKYWYSYLMILLLWWLSLPCFVTLMVLCILLGMMFKQQRMVFCSDPGHIICLRFIMVLYTLSVA